MRSEDARQHVTRSCGGQTLVAFDRRHRLTVGAGHDRGRTLQQDVGIEITGQVAAGLEAIGLRTPSGDTFELAVMWREDRGGLFSER